MWEGADEADDLHDFGLSDDEPSDSDPDPNPTSAKPADVVETFEGEATLAENLVLLEDGPALLELQCGSGI